MSKVAIFANDNSASTNWQSHYGERCMKHLEDFVNKVKNENFDQIHFLNWSTKCVETTYSDLMETYTNKKGNGGTSPVNVSRWIRQRYPNASIELWLTTDGQIDRQEVKACSIINALIDYEKINFFIESDCNTDCSVGASFICNSTSQIFLNSILRKSINTKNPFNYNEISLENFDSILPDLKDFIQAKFMASNEGALNEETSLTQLRNRLLKSIDQDCEKHNPNFFYTKSKDEILAEIKKTTFYKSYIDKNMKSLKYKVDSSISTLINYIHKNHKLHDFVDLKIEYKQTKMNEVKEEIEPSEEELPLVKDIKFDDVIFLEESNKPLVSLKIINLFNELWKKDIENGVENRSSKLFYNVSSCPITLLEKENFKKIVGHTYDVGSFRKLMQNDSQNMFGIFEDPQTRDKIYGGIIPFREADEWNDYIILKSLFGGKQIYRRAKNKRTYESISMWYYVFYKFAERCDWIEKSVVDALKSYAFARMSEGVCPLSFTNLPLDPKDLAPIGVALWYVSELSTILFATSENFRLEKLKNYFVDAQEFSEIAYNLGYDEIDQKAIQKRANTFSYVKKLNQIHGKCRKIAFVLEDFLEKKESFFIAKIKDIDKLQNFNYLGFSWDEQIPLVFPVLNLHDVVEKFLILSYEYVFETNYEICNQTFRPYYYVDKERNVEFWVPLTNALREVIVKKDENSFQINFDKLLTKETIDQKKLVSLCKTYIRYVCKKNVFPTLSQFTNYVLQRSQFVKADARVRLFQTNILDAIEQTYKKYDKTIALFQKEESPILQCIIPVFQERARLSASVKQRISMEEANPLTSVRKLKKIQKSEIETRLLERIKALKKHQNQQ